MAALVVTYNNADHIDSLLSSLREEAADVALRVVIADNSSSDGTFARVSAHPDVIAVHTGGNLGYAGGINVAAAHAGDVEALLVLNPDMSIEPGAISTMLEVLSDPSIGAVAPTLLDPDGSVFPSLRREPSVPRALGDALLGSRVRRRPAWSSETTGTRRATSEPTRSTGRRARRS